MQASQDDTQTELLFSGRRARTLKRLSVFVLAIGFVAACPTFARGAPPDNVAALADEFVTLAVSYDPTVAGLEAPDHRRFAERTPQAIRAFQRREDALLARLDRIPPASIAAAARRPTPCCATRWNRPGSCASAEPSIGT